MSKGRRSISIERSTKAVRTRLQQRAYAHDSQGAAELFSEITSLSTVLFSEQLIEENKPNRLARNHARSILQHNPINLVFSSSAFPILSRGPRSFEGSARTLDSF